MLTTFRRCPEPQDWTTSYHPNDVDHYTFCRSAASRTKAKRILLHTADSATSLVWA